MCSPSHCRLLHCRKSVVQVILDKCNEAWPLWSYIAQLSGEVPMWSSHLMTPHTFLPSVVINWRKSASEAPGKPLGGLGQSLPRAFQAVPPFPEVLHALLLASWSLLRLWACFASWMPNTPPLLGPPPHRQSLTYLLLRIWKFCRSH